MEKTVEAMKGPCLVVTWDPTQTHYVRLGLDGPNLLATQDRAEAQRRAGEFNNFWGVVGGRELLEACQGLTALAGQS